MFVSFIEIGFDWSRVGGDFSSEDLCGGGGGDCEDILDSRVDR
jgi:hypothetical protein